MQDGSIPAARCAYVEHAHVGHDASIRRDTAVDLDTSDDFAAAVMRCFRSSGHDQQEHNHGNSATQRPS